MPDRVYPQATADYQHFKISPCPFRANIGHQPLQMPSKPKKVKGVLWQEIAPGLFHSQEYGQTLSKAQARQLMQELSQQLPKDSIYRRLKPLFGQVT
jgi:hypothetical protein